MKKVIEFLKDENGQTSTEYILLLAVVAMVILRLRNSLQEGTDSILGNVFGRITSELESGL